MLGGMLLQRELSLRGDEINVAEVDLAIGAGGDGEGVRAGSQLEGVGREDIASA